MCVINFTLRRSKRISAPKKYPDVIIIDQARLFEFNDRSVITEGCVHPLYVRYFPSILRCDVGAAATCLPALRICPYYGVDGSPIYVSAGDKFSGD